MWWRVTRRTAPDGYGRSGVEPLCRAYLSSGSAVGLVSGTFGSTGRGVPEYQADNEVWLWVVIDRSIY